MKETTESIPLEDLNLDEIVNVLIAGESLERSDHGSFHLDTEDKRKIFAFYSRDIDQWKRSRQVRQSEVEDLLQVLKEDLPLTERRVLGHVKDKPVWHLNRVEIHRFAGLHQHLGSNGEEPDALVLDISKDLTMVSGFNAAGKTSLLSAIVWCLTGKALRSQDLPQEVHEHMTVKQVSDDDSETDQANNGTDTEIPPIVPIPWKETLKTLEGKPKLDTRVTLNFSRADSKEIQVVSRHLRVRGKNVTTTVSGLEDLKLPALAIEVGTLMPGIAAQMRFNEKSDFAQAVSELTGLKPLEELGQRSERVVNRLRRDENNKTKKEKERIFNLFNDQVQKFEDFWNQNPDFGEQPELIPPSISHKQEQCQSSIVAAQTELVDAREAMVSDVETLLGPDFDFSASENVQKLSQALDLASDQLKESKLREIPTVRRLSNLNEISETDADSALELVKDVLKRGKILSDKMEDERAFERGILYSRVAEWHKEFHADDDITNCPVCGTDLDTVPIDALADTNVKVALENCLSSDSDSSKTALEWEAHETSAFLDAIPSSIRAFVDSNVLNSLEATFRKAFVDELLAQRAFRGTLCSFQDNAKASWEKIVETNPLPDLPEPANCKLPDSLSKGKLQQRLTLVTHVLMLREHLKTAAVQIRSILELYIGSSTSIMSLSPTPSLSDGTAVPPEDEKIDKRMVPLLDQISSIRRAVQSVNPINYSIQLLDELEFTRKAWEAQVHRLSLLERAANAIESFVTFPELVRDRVSGLIAILDRNTTRWLNEIYNPHYVDGPDYGGYIPSDDGKFEVNAKIGEMCAPAHQVMNASLLKACIWAFLFALWEHVRQQSGVLSCMLLDDPQTHFDQINKENLARAIPALPKCGMRPLITCNDTRFLAHTQSELRSNSTSEVTWTSLRLNPISLSRLTASLSPIQDEIRTKEEQLEKDENDVLVAQDFVKLVRVDIEERLINFLVNDPSLPYSPTLSEILSNLRSAKNAGEVPFGELPFANLLDHKDLQPNTKFFNVINKAHHQPQNITPDDAKTVKHVHKDIRNVLRNCESAYTRFRNRSSGTISHAERLTKPASPQAVHLPSKPLTFLGELAASSDIDVFAQREDTHAVSLDELGPVVMYVVRGSTLGLVALPGQVVIASLEKQAVEGDPVVALCGNKTFVRRFHHDEKNSAFISLVSDRSGNTNVPPALCEPANGTRVLPIIGVLYDDHRSSGPDEAVEVDGSEILSRKLFAAKIVEDSAYPVIENADTVLLEEVKEVSPTKLNSLYGKMVAIITSQGFDSFGYLKRMGKDLGDGRYIFEKVGTVGSTICVATQQYKGNGNVLLLERLWQVHGFFRLS